MLWWYSQLWFILLGLSLHIRRIHLLHRFVQVRSYRTFIVFVFILPIHPHPTIIQLSIHHLIILQLLKLLFLVYVLLDQGAYSWGRIQFQSGCSFGKSKVVRNGDRVRRVERIRFVLKILFILCGTCWIDQRLLIIILRRWWRNFGEQVIRVIPIGWIVRNHANLLFHLQDSFRTCSHLFSLLLSLQRHLI